MPSVEGRGLLPYIKRTMDTSSRKTALVVLFNHQYDRNIPVIREIYSRRFSGLKTELPDKWEYYIDRLSCHIASTGKQYHSHAATIYKWAQEDAAKGKAAPKQGIPDYSCKEGESL